MPKKCSSHYLTFTTNKLLINFTENKYSVLLNTVNKSLLFISLL